MFFSSVRSGSSCQIYFMTLSKPGLANWWWRTSRQSLVLRYTAWGSTALQHAAVHLVISILSQYQHDLKTNLESWLAMKNHSSRNFRSLCDESFVQILTFKKKDLMMQQKYRDRFFALSSNIALVFVDWDQH